MKEYVENMKKYVKSMMEYVEILDLALDFHIYIGLGKWKNSEHSLHIVSGTWKNSTPELPPRLWDLEKFRSSSLHLHIRRLALGLIKILSSASIQALGFEKMLRTKC